MSVVRGSAVADPLSARSSQSRLLSHFTMPEPGRSDGGRPIKDLYLTDSYDQLLGIADEKMDLILRQDCRAVVNMVDRSVAAADQAVSQGDEERAFILYHRASQMTLKYRKYPDVDRKYFDAMISKSLNRSISFCELLSKSLQRRYDVLQELKQRQSGAALRDSLPAVPGSLLSNGSDTQPDTRTGDEAISCKELFQFVKSRSPAADPILLVLDVRPARQFQQSSISNAPFARPGVVVVNIPEEVVTAAATMSELEQRLQSDVVQTLRNRRSVHKIVLVDDSSHAKLKFSPLDIMYDLLWTFARGEEKSSHPPVILQGGFRDWVITYPMHVTDPSYDVVKSKSGSPAPETWAADYSNDEEKEEPVPVLPSPLPAAGDKNVLVNGHWNASSDSSLEVEADRKTWTKSHPGSAQPVSIPARTRPAVPNRSAKPNIPVGTAHSVPAASTNGTGDVVGQEKPAPGRKRGEGDTDEMLNQLTKTVKTISFDLDQRKASETSAPTSRIKSAYDEKAATTNAATAKVINGQPSPSERDFGRRTTDRTVSESKDPSGWKSGGAPGGMTRCYSSPNIAKIVEQNDTVLPEMPAFDRGKKPKIEVYRKKFREFNGIYGATDPGLTGLRNLGMTCYMSAIIQCLSNTKELYTYFVLKQKHESEINQFSKFGSRGELTEELAEVLKALWSGQYKSIAPRDLKNAVSCHMPSFMGCEQQDSHEFLTMLLEKLHYDLNQANEVAPVQLTPDLPIHVAIPKFWNNHLQRNDSLVSKTFEGLLLSTLICRHCLYESHTYETFTCLSLPIPSEQKCSLQDCLREEFTKTEKLETTWDCDRCKAKRMADRRIQLCKLPAILVIHLKRFVF